MRTLRHCGIALFLLLNLLGSISLSQTSNTSLQGSIADASGAAITNATIRLLHAESKTERTTTTGPQGEYRFQFLPPGTYTLIVSAAGFKSQQLTDLELLVNTPATVNVTLQVGGATETVSVTSEAPALN